MRSTWAFLALTLASCGGSGTKPEDMSVEEHEGAAASDEKAARLHDQLRRTRRHDDVVDSFALARLYASHAQAHAQAANALDAQHAAACDGVAPELQGECPLMRYRVGDVARLTDGVRVTYEGAEAGALLQHAECHRAHGASEGREEMPACPLYSKGLSLRTEPIEGGAALILTSGEAATVERVQTMYEPVGR